MSSFLSQLLSYKNQICLVILWIGFPAGVLGCITVSEHSSNFPVAVFMVKEAL
jgi:hypothetical protein